MRDPEKDKMLANAAFLLSLYTDDSVSGNETMGSIRQRAYEAMSEEEMKAAAAFLESGEATEYLRSLNGTRASTKKSKK